MRAECSVPSTLPQSRVERACFLTLKRKFLGLHKVHYNLWSCPWSWLRSSGGPRVGCLIMYCFLFLLGEVYKEAKGIAQVMVANELEARNGKGEAPKAPQEPKRAEAKKPAEQKRSKSKTSVSDTRL
ncbi:hypothetical protein SUGI_1075830 [Cryptomeria japonica]|nr:hypothetical protein SUGI_1075830 [Cryptomeria japonica]